MRIALLTDYLQQSFNMFWNSECDSFLKSIKPIPWRAHKQIYSQLQWIWNCLHLKPFPPSYIDIVYKKTSMWHGVFGWYQPGPDPNLSPK